MLQFDEQLMRAVANESEFGDDEDVVTIEQPFPSVMEDRQMMIGITKSLPVGDWNSGVIDSGNP